MWSIGSCLRCFVYTITLCIRRFFFSLVVTAQGSYAGDAAQLALRFPRGTLLAKKKENSLELIVDYDWNTPFLRKKNISRLIWFSYFVSR